MNASQWIQSRGFRVGAMVVGGLFLVAFGFACGARVGERRFRYFSEWNDRYEGFGRGMMGGGMMRGGFRGPLGVNSNYPQVPGRGWGMMPFPGAHGVSGQIVSVSGTAMVVDGADGVEQSIQTTSSTKIRSGAGDIPFSALSAKQQVVIFGEPTTDGQIEARLIRVLDTIPATTAPTSTGL